MVFVSQLRMCDLSTFNVVLFVQSYKLVHHVTYMCIAAYIVRVSVLSDYKGSQNITQQSNKMKACSLQNLI